MKVTITRLAVVTLVGLYMHVNVRSQQQSWLEQSATISEMYDQRGYMKDKARTVDGNLSVSRSTGNVQYSFGISSYTVNKFPLAVSLAYNQNASFTSYRRYDKDRGDYVSFKQNRPVWILGVNGFAVQALHHVARPVLAPYLRADAGDLPANETIVNSQFGEDDLVWLLDGYDVSNAPHTTGSELNNDEVLDEIRLLRTDGSVLSLVRMENRDEETDGRHLYQGTYVSAEANSSAFAIVTYARERMSARYVEAIKSLCERSQSEFPHYADSVPPEFIPRTVRYYPGDGSCYLFHEYKTPYGLEPIVGVGSVSSNSETPTGNDRVFSYSGFGEAAPSVFYLREIQFNTIPVVTFEYSAHHGQECPDHSILRGRADLTGFDDHYIRYGANFLNIEALGRTYEIRHDAQLLSGAATEYGFSNNMGWRPSFDHGSHWDHVDDYKSWTGLVTEILDPELRVYRLSYEPYRKIFVGAEFPSAVPSLNAQCSNGCSNPIHSTNNHTDLCLETARLVQVQDPHAQYEIEYLNPTSLWQGTTHSSSFQPTTTKTFLEQRYGADKVPDTDSEGFFTTFLSSTLGTSAIVDPLGTTVATSLVKRDRVNTSLLGLSNGGVLWKEEYLRDHEYSNLQAEANVPRSATTTVTRTVYSAVEDPLVTISREVTGRYKMPDQGYFNFTGKAKDRWIYHTDVIERGTRVDDLEEIERTEYGVGSAQTWVRNYHIPSAIVDESRKYTAGSSPTFTTIPRTRTLLEHVFSSTADYVSYGTRENDVSSRQAVFNTSYAPVLVSKTSILQKAINEATYTNLSKHIEEFEFLPYGGTDQVPLLVFDQWDRIASLQKFREVWKREGWSEEEAERRWNNSSSTDEWMVFHDPYEEDPNSWWNLLPPYSRLTTTTEDHKYEDGWQIVSRVQNGYHENVLLTSLGGVGAYGRLGSTVIVGEDPTRSRTQNYTYQVAHRVGLQISALSKVEDQNGSVSEFEFAGTGFENDGFANISSGYRASARQMTNAIADPVGVIPSAKDVKVDVPLVTKQAMFYEEPVHVTNVVRRPGGLPSMKLSKSHSYTHFGLAAESVDENGFVSKFEYDDIGRLKTAWLPLDFPSNPSDLSFDQLEDSWGQDAFGYTYEQTLSKLRLSCFVDCDDPEPLETNLSNGPTEIIDGLSVGIMNLPPGQCPCSSSESIRVQDKSTEEAQHILPAEAQIVETKKRVRRSLRAELAIPSSRIQSVTSAKVTIPISSVRSTFNTYAVELSIKIDDNVVVERGEEDPLIVGSLYGTLLEPVDYDPVGSRSGAITFDITNSAALFDVTSGGSTKHVLVEIAPHGDGIGLVEFGTIRIDIDGVVTSPEVSAKNDWTMRLEHVESPFHRVLTMSKVDDRNTANDVDNYPTLPNATSVVNTRHTKLVAELTTDDVVRTTRRGYAPDATGFMSVTPPAAASVTTTSYNGDGSPATSLNERSLMTTYLHDGWGRTRRSASSGDVLGWEVGDISEPTQTANVTKSIVSEETHDVGLPDEFGFDATLATRFGSYCKRILKTRLHDVSPTSAHHIHSASFVDGLGRTILEVSAYNENFFDTDILLPAGTLANRNLCTWFAYDALGRVISVTNPSGQVITYTYDDYGNQSSVNHPDQGKTTFSYDVAGRLRFSQSEQQAQASKMTFRQYDDLGRPTIVGEAQFPVQLPPAPGFPPVRQTDYLSPDVLHVPAYAPPITVNQTVFVQPAVPTPANVYVPYMLVGQGQPPTQDLLQLSVVCPPLANAMNTKMFNPAFPGLPNGVVQHAARMHQIPTLPTNDQYFEAVHLYPQFVLQSTWYDDTPPSNGAIWGGLPQKSVWDALAPHDTVRNQRGRASVVAYRTHGGQPFHYIVLSYDERGRVEAQLRLTENVGFDAVYYRYNAMNKITSIHVVDAFGQHNTFYGYDQNGRMSTMWTERSNAGLGLTMNPTRPVIPTRPTGTPDTRYSYDVADAVSSVEYPRINYYTNYSLNGRGALLSSETGSFMTTPFRQRLTYDEYGHITTQWTSTNNTEETTTYVYDDVDRLVAEKYEFGMETDLRGYVYDAVGNRLSRTVSDVLQQDQAYTHTPGTNHLATFTEAMAPAPPTRVHAMTYDLDGALSNRTKNDIASGMETQRIETFFYDAFKLIHRYTVRKDVAAVGSTLGCAVDAATQPMDEWRYRFGPLQEREQKRQYLTSGTVATDGLLWTYTLLGADAKQLATYNGLQGPFCGAPLNTVWMWPVEYNSYGPASTRVVMRPTGGREYVIHDHLGSARITLNNIGGVVESRSYRAFGTETISAGEGARTSYIGREKDNESDLGFYGVRMYEPTYGRFMSVDPLWGKYLPLQSYQYAGNSPVGALDPGGDTIVVLQDWEGASGAGHTAVLIGGDDKGWHLFSKNGGASHVVGESVDRQDWVYYKTLADFASDAVSMEKQGRYDNAFLIPTSAEEDANAKAAASAAVKSYYLLIGSSCVDVVSDALEAVGKCGGNGSVVPNTRVRHIIVCHKAADVSERVVSDDRKDGERAEDRDGSK